MSLKPINLRDILEYVPRFQDHTFVISLDSAIVEHTNFESILIDIAVLRSLNIHIVLTFGIAEQLRKAAEAQNLNLSDSTGEGSTNARTLELAEKIAGEQAAIIMKGLSGQSLPCALTNEIFARPRGIVSGEDQGFSGVIDRLNEGRIHKLMSDGVIPLFSPILYDNRGQAFRLNSDHLASSMAIALKASKLIYLTAHPGLIVGGKSILNLSLEKLNQHLETGIESINTSLISKARETIRALQADTDRVHILDGRQDGALLTEIFDKVGVGTMIHQNQYDQVRNALADDAPGIYALTKHAVKNDKLRQRSLPEIEANIADYLIYEVDHSILGSVLQIRYPDANVLEIASVNVQAFHQGKGIGRKLVGFAIEQAKAYGYDKVLALSTQATGYFTEQFAFQPAEKSDLPPDRISLYEEDQRNSEILVLPLK